jgi:hypothetical protein
MRSLPAVAGEPTVASAEEEADESDIEDGADRKGGRDWLQASAAGWLCHD